MSTFQRRRVVPRENWKPLKVAEAYREGTMLVVVVGADSPEIFETEEALHMARRTARRRGFMKYQSADSVEVFGQNHMALRKYRFKK